MKIAAFKHPTSAPPVCAHCGEVLRFTKRGWRHQDGTLYKQRTDLRCPRPGHRRVVGHQCGDCGGPLAVVTVDDHRAEARFS